MTTTMVFLNEGQKMIYGRKRIMDTFYKTHPVGKDVLEDEIGEITFDDDHVLLNVEDNILRIKKSEVIKNFWEHRTRTPSYFDYKIWRSRPQEGGKYIGVPIAAIDHNAQVNRILGSDIKVSTDKDGTKRIYFITPVNKSCTCGSFNQMKEHQTELAAEFNKYCPEIEFKPVCKHIKWYEKQLLLYTDIQLVNNRYPSNHPRICVYQYDYRRRKILYKITDNRYSPNMEWTPKDTWQEKDVYDPSSMPTGNCWEVLEGALSQPVPYKIHHYSSSIEAIMNKTYYPKKH